MMHEDDEAEGEDEMAHSDEDFRDAARKRCMVTDGVEVDEDALVSESFEGAYVSAWIWVDRADVKALAGKPDFRT